MNKTATTTTATINGNTTINEMACAQFNAQLNLAQTVCEHLITQGIVPVALHIKGVRPAIEIDPHSMVMPFLSKSEQVQTVRVTIDGVTRTQCAAEFRGCVLIWQTWMEAAKETNKPLIQ